MLSQGGARIRHAEMRAVQQLSSPLDPGADFRTDGESPEAEQEQEQEHVLGDKPQGERLGDSQLIEERGTVQKTPTGLHLGSQAEHLGAVYLPTAGQRLSRSERPAGDGGEMTPVWLLGSASPGEYGELPDPPPARQGRDFGDCMAIVRMTVWS